MIALDSRVRGNDEKCEPYRLGGPPPPSNRNGGRHCCQPPPAPSEGSAGVRQLDDPKVLCSSILAHQLRRRFRSWSCSEEHVRFLPRPFLGHSPFASPALRREPRVARERITLPAPLPTGPTWNRSSSSSPAGRDRTFRPFLPREAGTSVPITHSLWAAIRVAQSEKIESLPVDNGDIAHN